MKSSPHIWFSILFLQLFSFQAECQQLFVFPEIDPNLSPFIYEWENPSSGSINFIVENQGTGEVPVLFQSVLMTEGGEIVAQSSLSGVPVILIPPGNSQWPMTEVIPLDAVDISDEFEQVAVQTAQLPEGGYTFCVQLFYAEMPEQNASEEQCSDFFIQGYQDVVNIFPPEGQVISSTLVPDVLFQWTQVVPPPPFFQDYQLSIYQVLVGQAYQEAVLTNEPILTEFIQSDNQFVWPTELLAPFGNTEYAWTVSPLTPGGDTYTTPNGTSEPTSFFVETMTQSDCLGCMVEDIGFMVDGLESSETQITVDENISFYPMVDVQCSNTEGSPQFEGYFEVVYVDNEGNTQEYTILDFVESTTFPNEGSVTVTYVGDGFCTEGGVTCPCDGNNTETYEIVSDSVVTGPCECGPCEISSVAMYTGGNQTSALSTNLSYSFSPVIIVDCTPDDCESTVSYEMFLTFEPSIGNAYSLPDPLSSSDTVSFSSAGNLSIHIDAVTTCGTTSCLCSYDWSTTVYDFEYPVDTEPIDSLTTDSITTLPPGVPTTESPPYDSIPDRWKPPYEIEPPDTVIYNCSDIIKTEDKADPIDLGMILDEPDIFPYPRAVPLRAEGEDWDYVIFKCSGCQGGESERKYPVKDRMDLGLYKWELTSGIGSLNSPIQADSVKSTEEKIDSIKSRLQAIEDRKAELQDRLDSGISADSTKFKNRLDEALNQKAEIDSVLAIFVAKIDSITGLITADSTLMVTLETEIQVLRDSISIKDAEVETLQELLQNPPSTLEMELRDLTDQARQAHESLQEQYETLEAEISEQSVELAQNVELKDSLLQVASGTYTELKNQAESLAESLTGIETQLYSNPLARDYFQRKREWSNKALHILNWVSEPSLNTNIFTQRQTVNTNSMAVATAIPANRLPLYNEFYSSMSSFNNYLNGICSGLETEQSEVCIPQRTELLQAGALYDTALYHLAASTHVIDAAMLEEIDNLRFQIEALEPQVITSKGNAESASEEYEESIEEFVTTMDELELEKEEMLGTLNISEDTLNARSFRFQTETIRRQFEFESKKDSLLNALHDGEQSILRYTLDKANLKDSLEVVTKGKEAKEDEKFELEKEKKRLSVDSKRMADVIANLEEIMAKLAAERQAIADENEELDEEKSDLEDEIKELEELLQNLLSPSKTADGPIVYYVPPPLEEVMKEMGTYPRFEEKVKKVKEAESDLSGAIEEKEAIQGKVVKEVHKTANSLMSYKKASDEEEALASSIEELDMQIAALQGELTLDYQENQSLLQDVLESAENKLDTAQNRKNEAEQDSIEIKFQMTDLKIAIETAEQALKTAKSSLKGKKGQLQVQEKLLTNSENTLKNKSNVLDEKGTEYKELKDDLGRAQNDLSRANATGDDDSATGAESEISDIESDISSIETVISVAKTDVASAKSSNDANATAYKTAMESFEDDEKDYLLKKHLVDSLNQDLIKLNVKMEAALSGINYWQMVEEKAEKLIDKTNKAREEYQGEVADEVNSDERIVGLKEEKADAAKGVEAAKNTKASKKDSINESVKKKKKLEDEANEKLKEAKEKLEEAEEDLKEFLRNQMDSVTYEVEIKLIGNDQVVSWRSDDDEEELTNTLKYQADRVPIFQNIHASASLPDEFRASVCNPLISPLIPPDPGDGDNPTKGDSEPRTKVLLFDEGRPLWPEWPVIPDDAPPLIAKDVVPLNNAFALDTDDVEYSCITSADCQVSPPKTGSPADVGSYKWTPEQGRIVSKDVNHRYTLWEPQKVPIPKIEEEQKFKSFYFPDLIAPDIKKEAKGKVLVVPGVLIEVTDSLIGTADTTMQVQARVVLGDHKGLAGEKIEFSLILEDGESEDYGFGGDTLIVKKTDAQGYAKTDFDFGDGYAKFKIHAKWLRGDQIVDQDDFPALAPLKVNFHKIGSSAPDYAWLKAVDLIMAGSELSATSLDNIAEEFPTCLGDDEDAPSADCKRVIRGIAGILDNEREYVNEELLEFESDFEGLSLNEEQDSTAWFGIAYTKIDSVGEDQQFEVLAKLEEKFLPVGRPGEDASSYSTSKIEKFYIGPGENLDSLFVIILDEPVSEGDMVNGTGKLGMPEGGAYGIMIPLQQETFNITDVVLSEDENPIAKTGTVSWLVPEGVSANIAAFDLRVDSLYLTAGMSAGLGGKVNHDKLNNPVGFDARVAPSGDFVGNINNLPELSLFDFTLKEGASITLDMHSTEGPIDELEKGIIIHTATLELPESFTITESGERTAIHALDLYIGNSGLGGTVAMTGTLPAIGFAGYNYLADSIAIKFKDHKIDGFGIAGIIQLPAPMEGNIPTLVKYNDEAFVAQIDEDTNPVSIPRLEATLTVLSGSGIMWNTQNKYGELTLNSVIVAKDIGEMSLQGFMINSKGEIKADAIAINKAIEFGKGFELHVDTVSFKALASEYSFKVSGGFAFGLIGLDKISGSIAVAPGPQVSVAFTEAKIEFEKGPTTFSGEFAYSGTEFRGQFDVAIKNILENGVKGLFIVGTQAIDETNEFTYWYVELVVGVKIPIGQTGVSILALGGGVGHNYSPPRGSEPGNPKNDIAFSLKAIVNLGNTPGGELFEGRMEMIYEPAAFTVYGKLWLLKQQENLFGEGQLTMAWDPFSLDGFVRMFVGLPDAKGDVIRFDGKVNFLFSEAESYIKSERITGAFLNSIEGKAVIEVDEDHTLLDGELGYELNKTFGFGIVDIIVDLDVKAHGNFEYVNAPKTLSVTAEFNGDWDVDLDTPLGTADIMSGSLNLNLALAASPGSFSATGSADVDWNVWIYSDETSVSVGYSSSSL